MLSPSDFNNAVPKFTNGNYASNPLNPQYIAEPSSTDYNRGVEPLQTLPAQWWNWFLNKFTGRFNKVNIYVKNIFNELAQILSIFNITPDGTEATPTTSQLKTIFACCYPEYVKTTACLVGTETTVNGHPLTGNVTVTRSDLGLGTSATVNTGTAVGCIPTVGTALGTTNNNILVTDATGKLKPSGITVDTAVACPLGTASAGVATTVARSDHVHPMPTCVECSCCACYAMQSTGEIPFSASDTLVYSGCFARAVAVSMYGVEWGFVTKVALGAVFDGQTTGCGYSSGVLSVGKNDTGTAWNDFYFRQGAGGDVVTSTTIASYCVGNATYATSAGTANSACSVPMNGVEPAYYVDAYNGWIYRKELVQSVIPGLGYASRVAIGQCRTSNWGCAVLSVGVNDAGTAWYDYVFGCNGTVTGVNWMPNTRVSCADCATSATTADSATTAGSADSATDAFGLISLPLTADIHQPVYRDGNDIINNSNRPILFWENSAGSTVYHARRGTNPGELTGDSYTYALV